VPITVGNVVAGDFVTGVLAYVTMLTVSTVGRPLLDIWKGRSIPALVRATALSVTCQSDAFGQVVGGPLIGAVGSPLRRRHCCWRWRVE